MALNPDIYIHGILYCAEYLRRSPLSITEKCLIGLMLDFSDADPEELISVIEVSYNHNLPTLVQNMNLDKLAEVYSKMALYGAYRSDVLFIWFRIYSIHLEKVSGKSQAPLLQMSDKRVFSNWMNTNLNIRTSKFFEQKSNRDWLTKQIRYIWKKNSLTKDLNAEAFLRSELYFVLENDEDTENIDSFLDISFNYRVPQNVLSQDRSFRTQLERRLSLLGGMATICIEIWSRALLTFEESERFLESASLKQTSSRSQQPSPKPVPKRVGSSRDSQPKSASNINPLPKTNPLPRTKNASTTTPIWSQPTAQQPPQSASPAVPSQNKSSGWPCGCWLIAIALLAGARAMASSDSTYASMEYQSGFVNPASQVTPKDRVRNELSNNQRKGVLPSQTIKRESDTQEMQTLPLEQEIKSSPLSIDSKEKTESIQDLKHRACRVFVQKAQALIKDCRLKWRDEDSEFFIVSVTSSNQAASFEFLPEPKRYSTTCGNKHRQDFHQFAGVFDSNEVKDTLYKSILKCKM